MRSIIKAVAERALLWSGVASLHRRRMRGQALILAYHNVVPDQDAGIGDVANHLPLSKFTQQLDELSSTHDVVALPELIAPRDNPRPRAAITFDDAYRGAIVHAIPELVHRGLPATVFVAPSFLGGKSFWWDAIAASGAGGLDPALREHALQDLRGVDDDVRRWTIEQGRTVKSVPDVACAASEDEVLHAASLNGISLGAHTWSHPNLTRLAGAELEAELVRPMAWLREHVPDPLPWIAYPYGFFNESVERAAREAGYDAALAISGGWVSNPPSHRYAIPRVNVAPGLSIQGFALRAAGLLAN